MSTSTAPNRATGESMADTSLPRPGVSGTDDGQLWIWPPLPEPIAHQLQLLLIEAANEEAEEPEDLVEFGTGQLLTAPVARPWDLGALEDPLRAEVLAWLDEVVQWLNHSYGWQEEQLIPACWPYHPGLALDLAALAFGRVDAYATTTAAFVSRWHSDWEDFQRRMNAGQGDSGRDCRRGEHERPSNYAITAVFNQITARTRT